VIARSTVQNAEIERRSKRVQS